MPASEVLPETIKRSPKHAQEIYSAALDSAIKEYGDGRRAHQTAYSALKHEYEKVGDHWQKKDESGPSDAGAKTRGGPTAGGVDANASKSHLMDVAKELNISGRTNMSKDELVKEIQKANNSESAKARKK